MVWERHKSNRGRVRSFEEGMGWVWKRGEG